MVKDNEEDVEKEYEAEEAEYHYSDPDASGEDAYEGEPEQPEQRPLKGNMGSMMDDKRKRIILILVVVGLIFVMMQFVKAKNKSNPVAEPVPASNIEKAATQSASMADKTTPNGLSAADVAAISGQSASDALSKAATPQPSQMEELQTSISKLETDVAHLTDSVNLLQTQVQDLLKKAEHAAVNKPSAPPVQKARRRIYKKHRETGYKMGMRNRPKVYYVKAVVPRRAWLQTENGEAITVKIDDAIPGYGIVRSIDATEGVVTTSSNKIIRFSANDN